MKRPNQLSHQTIGLISGKMAEQGLNQTQLARKMQLTASAVTKIVNQGRAVTLDRLFSLSVALQYNFFEEISRQQELQNLEGPPAGQHVSSLQQQVTELSERIHDLEVENRTLLAVLQQSKG
ncbi:helix-turn-helix domain-containing protein [Mangrovibacterium lignilyticum]|uniref:helix-turn-helix domain-containing protein n=1 Tax=Mangrovibacterium lignilyticum TaxID=2668052 RepID=UPI0013D4E72D|nr:helix-turn-helix transcriptional regulator [Mangrovibacterium lignilyticum]